MKHPYHTALRQSVPEVPVEPMERAEFANGVIFRHDISKGLPLEFKACDVFYGDPPWEAGYKIFNERAGLAPTEDYGAFARRLHCIGKSVTAPLVYVVGQRAAKMYFDPDSSVAIDMHAHSSRAVAIAYRMILPTLRTAEELLTFLAGRYQCVGDFMAGYGRSGRIFATLGKKFVLSDANAECVGRMARAKGWAP